MYRFSIILLTVLVSNDIYASTNEVTIDIVGDKIISSDAIFLNDDVISPGGWSNTSRLNLLPIESWAPVFLKTGLTKLNFTNSVTSETVIIENFSHTGMDFRYSDANAEITDLNIGRQCTSTKINGGVISLIDDDVTGRCVSNKKVKYLGYNSEPFEFYKGKFKLQDLVGSFKRSGVGAGTYMASYSYKIAYVSILGNGVNTYDYYSSDIMTFKVNYQPAFINSHDVVGDGIFKLTYDTTDHSVSGETKYTVTTNGYIDPGVFLTFSASRPSDFELVHKIDGYKVAYNIDCVDCVDKEVVKDGKLVSKERSKINYTGNSLSFDIRFWFDKKYISEPGVSTGTVIEGKYYDSVTLLLELDI
ncbi:hypothetical protein EDB65_102272 [Vibrio crassostreae]|uniref:hypothetical protein n=1 Tax=Vibrio crassostreae TaxID=246167 RepID=UPI00104D3AD3|nr:hypothetical protein [Vibrio crassostreae]TCN88485.1 hypothetical protein EDB65_102272 [Vibrio crassostreae]